MELTFDELAARIEAEAETAPDRLRSAIELSRQLAETGDAVVERFVSDARREGMAWAEIGELFGTSRQAAQQRFGRVSPSVS
jgi:hypothetical protein